MLRLGLTQRVVAVETRGERRDALDQAWTRCLAGMGYLPVPLPNAIECLETFVDALALDGFVLTGGNDLGHLAGARDPAPDRDALERRVIDLAAARELPLLGVCRGFQMLVTHYGGTLSPVTGHAGTTHPLVARARPSAPLGERDAVNSFHDFGVREDAVGAELQVLAAAPDGTVEAVAHRALPQWGILWHPERAPRDHRDAELFHALFQRGRR